MPALIDNISGMRQVPVDRLESREQADEGMAEQTIFPFFLDHDGEPLSYPQTRNVYDALNRDIARLVGRKSIDGRAYHLGQPVAINMLNRESAGALRVSTSARIISQAWDPLHPTEFAARIGRVIDDLAEALHRTAHLGRIIATEQVQGRTE